MPLNVNQKNAENQLTENTNNMDHTIQRSDAEIIEERAQMLIETLLEAHYKAGKTNNSISREVAAMAFYGSGDPMGSCASALLTTGKAHGPLDECRDILMSFRRSKKETIDMLRQYCLMGKKLPGIGNSFFKDKVDPAFQEAYRDYRSLYLDAQNDQPLLDAYVFECNKMLSEFKEKPMQLPPNAAGITAAICDLLNRPRYEQNWFFIAGRSKAWLEDMQDSQTPSS